MDHTQAYQDDQDWWHNPNHPKAFTYCDLDDYYPDDYIEAATMPPHVIEAYVRYVEEYYKKITGKDLTSVVEFGSAGGWFLKAFQDKGYRVLGFEGSTAGVNQCLKHGVLPNNIVKHDLRNPIGFITSQKFDIALTSETLEHCEESFCGTMARTITEFSDLIWFSSEAYATNRPHLHHCNEQPHIYWVRLFDFLGYKSMDLPDNVYYETAERSRAIFIRK